MRKNSHFSGQPLYGQVIKLLDKSKNLFNSVRKTEAKGIPNGLTAGFIWW